MRAKRKPVKILELDVAPLNNGWVVTDSSTGKSSVFVDREKMIEYINDTIPPMVEEQNFIDSLDDEEEINSNYMDETERMKRAINSMMNGMISKQRATKGII